MLPHPKYDIGQVVFKGHAYYGERRETCPDCLGRKEWSVATPAGETFSTPCNTCNEGYFSVGTIRRYGEQASVQEVTIGSVRLDTNDDRHPVSYMCLETGVGSGQVHYEDSLFLTADEARNYANAQAAINTARRNEQEEADRSRKKKSRVRKPSTK